MKKSRRLSKTRRSSGKEFWDFHNTIWQEGPKIKYKTPEYEK